MKNPKITVFTPTYNRSYILDNLYQSLKNQTCYDFEWLIIDDGSTDDTEILIKKWISEETLFNIKYHKKQNGGKHRAINIGVELAKGKLFFIVDSDDKVLPDSVEKIIDWESKLPRKEKFAGVAGNRAYSNDQVIGKTFTGDFIDATSLERERFNIMGDKAEAFYTDILKRYKFPEFEGENFITESVVWFKIASDGYKIRWFNEVLYITEYLPDGLTVSSIKHFTKNPEGSLYACKLELKYRELSLRWKLSRLIRYIKIAAEYNKSVNVIARELDISVLFVLVAYFALYIKERL